MVYSHPHSPLPFMAHDTTPSRLWFTDKGLFSFLCNSFLGFFHWLFFPHLKSRFSENSLFRFLAGPYLLLFIIALTSLSWQGSHHSDQNLWVLNFQLFAGHPGALSKSQIQDVHNSNYFSFVS